MIRRHTQSAFTLIEVLIGTLVGALLVTVLASIVARLTESRTALQEYANLTQDARFAMERMQRAVASSRDLLLPLADVPATDWREHVREETVPASPPEGSSTRATAVLAVSLGANIDLDADGIPDADNDGDGKFDEDLPGDASNDKSPGIHLVDDNGDGIVDNVSSELEDDEDSLTGDEDPVNGLDDDADGLIDEDPGSDMNNDGSPGYAGVDDDGDGQVDEGSPDDDDEDGTSNEDWFDPVVFYLSGSSLIERHPVPWDENASGSVTGLDFVESTIAEGVSRFRVERIVGSGNGEIVDITLELSGAEAGNVVSLNARVRVGGAL